MQLPDVSLPDRRTVLKMAIGLGALAALGTPGATAQPVATRARIIIAGAGAAGLAIANRLSQRLQGATITLIDARRAHYYQPGFTLVAAGLKQPSYAISGTHEYVPRNAQIIESSVAEFDPDANAVTTSTGQRLEYDYLIVATGLTLDYEAIEGMSRELIGTEGIGSVYAGPQEAAATYRSMSDFADVGGVGLFGRPETEMKCAGAPLKYAFITEDTLSRRGNRGKAELVYTAHNASLFGVPIVSEKVRMLFEDRGIDTRYNHVMTAIDPGRRIATFRTPEGSEQIGYDFINVIPPMRAPQAVRQSALAWQSGPLAADGWVEVDPVTLRHVRYNNIFAVGDIAGVQKGKTAASVKWQVPVAVDHIIADLAGTESDSAYNGYTSCPLITRIGRAMLVEFDYNNNLVPSFPGLIPPLEELWSSWMIKETALRPTYLAMLRGQA